MSFDLNKDQLNNQLQEAMFVARAEEMIKDLLTRYMDCMDKATRVTDPKRGITLEQVLEILREQATLSALFLQSMSRLEGSPLVFANDAEGNISETFECEQPGDVFNQGVINGITIATPCNNDSAVHLVETLMNARAEGTSIGLPRQQDITAKLIGFLSELDELAKHLKSEVCLEGDYGNGYESGRHCAAELINDLIEKLDNSMHLQRLKRIY